MKNSIALAATFCALGLLSDGAWAADPTDATTHFTEYQASRVKLCIGAADMGRAMAQMKAKGKSEQELVEYYTSRGVTDSLMRAIANDVTVSDTSNIWNFSVGLAGKCAKKIAAVDPAGEYVARFCMQQYLRASVAAAFKVQDKPFTAVQDYFQKDLATAGPRELTELNDAIQTGYSLGGDKVAVSSQVADKCVDRYAPEPAK